MVDAEQGDLITVNPGEVHDGVPIGGGRAWSMLYLSTDLVGSIAADITDGQVRLSELKFPVVRDLRIRRRFAAAYGALTDPNGRDGGEAHLILLFATLLHDRTICAGMPTALARIRERIDDDPSVPHPLEELASLAGISRYQAIRGFARMTGFTPHAYLLQRRLDLACRLIREGSALADAAVAAGFADQSHLNRLFTARFGLTPGAYALARLPRRNFVQ